MSTNSFTIDHFFTSIILLLIFMGLGYLVKQFLFKKYEIPTSLFAGFIALLIGPEVFGTKLSDILPGLLSLPLGLLPDFIISTWKELPVYLITVVFASLFLGMSIPGLKSIFRLSSPNLVYGYSLAVGQYVVELLIALLVLSPLFGSNKMVGALLPIGFQGGHGTVAGLKQTFESLNLFRCL